MLIGVTLMDGDPWVRPFVRWICRRMTGTAVEGIIAAGHVPPDYAACILVDRPARTGPTGSQEAFASDVYEVRNRTLARIN